MITNVSRKLAGILCHYSNRKQEIDVVRYGLEIILGGIVKAIILLAISAFFSITDVMLSFFLTFAIFRGITGGHHYSTYGRCLSAGLVIIIGISLVVNKTFDYISNEILLTTVCLSVLFAFSLTYLYAPSNHYKKSTQQQRNNLRNFAFLLIALWGILVVYLLTTSFSTELILASIIGFVLQISSIHPVTYFWVNKIESIIDGGLKR